MFRKLAVVVAFAIAIAALPAAAQDEVLQAKKYDSLEWFQLVSVQFESGKMEDALKIIKEHFVPAAEASGFKMPKVFQCYSGEWDVMFLFHLEEGITELEWELSPSSIKWFTALVELEGGLEAAEKIYAEYEDMIEDWDIELIRWVDMAPPAKEAAE